jgi:hypothetical protein
MAAEGQPAPISMILSPTVLAALTVRRMESLAGKGST